MCRGLTVPTYTRQQQASAGVDLLSVPAGSFLRQILADADQLEREVRAVCG